ncbi:hypothetical protein [Streptomyces sp. NPDC001970]
MEPMEREGWEAAAERLFDDTYSYVATGPRHHDEWREDVLAVMARAVPDPRGWAVLDWDIEDDRRNAPGGEFFPFAAPTVESLADVYEISPDSAAHLLVAMTDEWFETKNIPGFPERRDSMLADAHLLLSRYGPGCTFCTTSVAARASKDPDFSQGASAGRSLTLLMDVGLIAVSDTEVGVFWSFNAY